jgi:hypothetical protein
VVGDPEKKIQADGQLRHDPHGDPEEIRAIKHEIEEIDGLMEETGNSSERLEQRKAELQRQLLQAARPIQSQLTNTHHNIATQIRNLRKKMRADMPKLAAHLHAALKMDLPDFLYSPTDAIAWEIEE